MPKDDDYDDPATAPGFRDAEFDDPDKEDLDDLDDLDEDEDDEEDDDE